MESSSPVNPPLNQLETPCFVVDVEVLRQNGAILLDVQKRAGVKILLALKAFSGFGFFAEMKPFYGGTAASGVHEARLGREEFGKEVHTYSPGFQEKDIEALGQYSDHIILNSLSQWEGIGIPLKERFPQVSLGLRINPGVSTADVAIYDPCAPFSRLGLPLNQLPEDLPKGLEGLHFHALCEQDYSALEKNLDALEAKIPHLLHKVRWLNLGGGHHITAAEYDREALVDRLIHLRTQYGLEIYMEPGEAAVLGSGIFVTRVVDTLKNGMDLGILDCSVTTHLPDVLEMPYRPEIRGAGSSDQRGYTYRLGGVSCLAGDVLGDYSFSTPLRVGQPLILEDMTHYTMVKTTTFNGVPLPSIYSWDSRTQELKLVKRFGYEDFKGRLS